MFDIAPSELLLVAVVALLVIGPKDLPLALRTAGKWLGKVRRMSNHFRAGVESMIREAELAEIEKEWRERNARIMAEHPDAAQLDAAAAPPLNQAEMLPTPPPAPAPIEGATAEAALTGVPPAPEPDQRPTPEQPPAPGDAEPELPLRDTAKTRRG